jgi:hypothetical protein
MTTLIYNQGGASAFAHSEPRENANASNIVLQYGLGALANGVAVRQSGSSLSAFNAHAERKIELRHTRKNPPTVAYTIASLTLVKQWFVQIDTVYGSCSAGVSFDGMPPFSPAVPPLPNGDDNYTFSNANYSVTSNGSFSFTISIGAYAGGYTGNSTYGIAGYGQAFYYAKADTLSLHN